MSGEFVESTSIYPKFMTRLLASALVIALLAGCATLEPATPSGYSGPTADVTDVVLPQSSLNAYIYEMQAINGRRIRSSIGATRSASSGGGFHLRPVTVTRAVPAVPTKVTLALSTEYGAPIQAMLSQTCAVTGEVEFDPKAGKRYRVNGKVGPEACAVWIEDTEKNLRVTPEVSGPGLKF